MSRKKSIIIIVLIAVLIIGAALMIIPLNSDGYVQIGDSNYDFYWVASCIDLGLDLKGGVYAIFEADLTEFDDADTADAAMEGTIANLSSLLFSKGYTEASVTRYGDSNIRVEVPAVSDTDELMALLGEPAELEFQDSDGNVLLEGAKHLESATAVYYDGSYAISLTFNDEGTELFAQATEDNLDSTISIYINGELIMSPTVNSTITDGEAVITGGYTYAEANELAVQLQAGAFEVSLTVQQVSTISATLGEDALTYAILAGIIGLAVVGILMLIIYRGFGVTAVFALIIYTELMMFALALVPWVQLTLPGIAGVILSIGMAVDANVIIFERIKDEMRASHKSINSAVKGGFKKALTTIVDANVTTIIGSIVMIIFGSTTIQSFAITLLIGIILSMFTAIVITRLLINISLSFNEDNELYYGLVFKEVE
ncbi:MAG: protein translocase subunit SecD [Bacillota bacterium]